MLVMRVVGGGWEYFLGGQGWMKHFLWVNGGGWE